MSIYLSRLSGAKMSRKDTELVEVMPIEYQFKVPKGRHPRLQIYWGYSFSRRLTQAIFNRILKDFRQKDKVKVSNNRDRFIVYQFASKPQICLDRLTGKICVTRGALNHYSRQHCQQQASFVLRILKGSKKDRGRRPTYASFKRISVTCNPDRIGRTREERQIYFEAVMDLFNDKPKVRLKKIREAAHAK